MDNQNKVIVRSVKKEVEHKSLQVSLRIGGFLIIVFSSLFFYQQTNQKSYQIEQKLNIDRDILVNALKIGDYFFITRYLSSFVKSGIIEDCGIREKNQKEWIQVHPNNSKHLKKILKKYQFTSNGILVTQTQNISDKTNNWEITYLFRLKYQIFLFSFLLSTALSIIIFLFTNFTLRGIANHFTEPLFNISNDLNSQLKKTNNNFNSLNYDIGLKFLETNQMVKELKILFHKIEKQNEELKSVEIHKAVSQLSRQVSHDIQSPLGALKVASSKLSSNPVFAEKLILKSLTRIDSILKDLHLVTTLKKKILKRRKTNLISLIHSIIEEKLVEYDQKSINFNFTFNKDIIHLYIDEHDIARSFSNIINNSIEELNGRNVNININVLAQNSQVLVEFSDNGNGVSPDQINSIFEHGVSTKGNNNSGSGLSQARDTMNAHNGSLTLKANENLIYNKFLFTFSSRKIT